jgi:flagellar hook-associated protein 1 FlgK
MGMSSALNNALSGLSANARIAEVVSSNLSNALTDGYGRRSVELSSVQVGDVGGGVKVTSVNRFVDAGILADRRLVDASLAGQERSADILLRLQQSLGGPEDAAGIGSRISALEGALINASSDPASPTRLSDIVTRLQDVTRTLQSNTKTIQSLRQEADGAIDRDIATLNRSLQQVAQLNGDVLRISASGADPSALLDARQRIVDQIAQLIPVRETVRENGTIGLMTTNGFSLLDSEPAVFSFTRTPTITADMTFASGALSGLEIDGVALDPGTGVGRLDGGAIGAAFALRDSTLVDAQAGLDTIAADLIARFQDPANDPTIAAGDLGLLTDQGGLLDLADLSGLAGRISVNQVVVTAQGGNPEMLRDGLNALAPGPEGDPAQINRWIASFSDIRADVVGSFAQSAGGRAGAFVSQLGNTRFAADESLSFTQARWETLREAELADGVDTDQELQILLRVEQSYAANAKVIQTVDFMMQRLLEI